MLFYRQLEIVVMRLSDDAVLNDWTRLMVRGREE